MLENRINRVTIRNFRSIEDVTVDLEDLTVLVGPNGSGKSNFVDALHFVSDALRYGLVGTFSSPKRRSGMNSIQRRPPHGQSRGNVEIEIDLTLNGQASHYGFILSSPGFNEYRIESEACTVGEFYYEIKQGEVYRYKFSQADIRMAIQDKNLRLPLVSGLPEFVTLYNFLTSTGFYSFFPDDLPHIQPSSEHYPLSERGENLAAVLHDFESENYEGWRDELYKTLSHIVPGIRQDNPIRVIQVVGGNFVVYIQHDDGNLFELARESDGTIRVLTLLTALYQRPPLSVIGIEEPEALIHPGAMGILSDVIYEASHRSQIILTTYSPDFISRVKAESLRIVELVNSSTKIGPLMEEQRQIIEEQLFSGGDLLRIEGLRRG